MKFTSILAYFSHIASHDGNQLGDEIVLDFSSQEMESIENVIQLCHLVENNTTIDLSNCNIDDKKIELLISPGVLSLSSGLSLKLAYNPLGYDGIIYLIKNIIASDDIQDLSLDLTATKIGLLTFLGLSQLLRKSLLSKLISLNLSMNDLSNTVGTLLQYILLHRNQDKHFTLNLSGIKIGNKDAALIASALESNILSNFTLDLSQCQMSDKSARCFIKFLNKQSYPEDFRLIVSGNLFSDEKINQLKAFPCIEYEEVINIQPENFIELIDEANIPNSETMKRYYEEGRLSIEMQDKIIARVNHLHAKEINNHIDGLAQVNQGVMLSQHGHFATNATTSKKYFDINNEKKPSSSFAKFLSKKLKDDSIHLTNIQVIKDRLVFHFVDNTMLENCYEKLLTTFDGKYQWKVRNNTIYLKGIENIKNFLNEFPTDHVMQNKM